MTHADEKQTGITGRFQRDEESDYQRSQLAPTADRRGSLKKKLWKGETDMEGVVKLEEAQLLTDSWDVQNKPMKERN